MTRCPLDDYQVEASNWHLDRLAFRKRG